MDIPTTDRSTKSDEYPAGFVATKKYLPSSVGPPVGPTNRTLEIVRLMLVELINVENEKDDVIVLLVALVMSSPNG